MAKKNAKKLKKGKFRRQKLLSTFHSWSRKSWAPLTIIAISLLLAFLNYQPGTWLTGWDNLHPEFLFKTNIKRSLFAVWQEYQGLGLLGGMAHASDLPHQLFLYLLSALAVPSNLLRYIYTFTMLTLGPLGVYFFINNFILKSKFDRQTKQFAALLGALFYLLNLSTVQNFFVPFETFTSFYGFFPWIILSVANYRQSPGRRSFLFLTAILLLSTPSFYVETLFVVLLLCLLPLFKVTNLKQTLLTLLTILITQAFWLLPVIFFVLTNGHIGEQAKINLISTPETYLRNLEYANLKSLGLLKGFWFSFLDLAPNHQFAYLLQTWREHLQNPLITLLGFLNFTLVITGIYYAFKKRVNLASIVFYIAAISSFFLLGGGLLINRHLPFVAELFRSPFTKFSTPLSFSYAIFFSIGSIFLLDLFSFIHNRLTYFFTLFSLSLALIIFTAPAFSGQLISPNMKQKIPPEYFQVFEFFKNQDPNTRIANFPQHTFWGWNFYSWGYRGSGFLWYGIKQPILDRAFDVWEKQNQNYYEEINTALYSGNQEAFQTIVDKYAINWILIDKFVISPQPGQSLYNRELIDILNTSNHFRLEKNINNNILIYKTDIDKRVNNYLSLTPNQKSKKFPFKDLSLRPNTNWKKEGQTQGSDPERSGYNRGLLDYQIKEGSYPGNIIISLPSYTQTENLVPVEISYKKLNDQILLKFSPLLPTVYLKNKQFKPQTKPNYLTLNIPSFYSSLILKINDQYFELLLPGELAIQPIFYPLTTAYLPSQKTINVSAYNNSPSQSINAGNGLKESQPYQCYTHKKDRQIEKIVFQDSVSLLGTDVVGCLSLPLPSFTPPGLISIQYTYFSPTSTPANSNITSQDLSFSTTPPQPLKPKTLPFTTRQFSPLTLEKQQLNLILEANNSKSVQEITYQNISANFHHLLASANFTLNPIQGQTWDFSSDGSAAWVAALPSADSSEVESVFLSFSLPLINSSLNILQTPSNNQLLPEGRNCNQFRSGAFKKTTTRDLQNPAIQYFAQNATACDTLDLRHLPHSTSYLIQIDYRHLKGLPLTVCLENYSTGRCDVFERLPKGQTLTGASPSGGTDHLRPRAKEGSDLNEFVSQSLIQPISNSQEAPGYSLHLFNQSIGERPTINQLKSIYITPIPLNFLQNIQIQGSEKGQTLTGDSPDNGESGPLRPRAEGGSDLNKSTLSSTHPAEFLYTLSINKPAPSTLNLYQTYSPYWLAITKDLTKDGSKKGQTQGSYPGNTVSLPSTPSSWHNSWQLPPGKYQLILVYLPQYLEFLGFFLLLLLPLIFYLQGRKHS